MALNHRLELPPIELLHECFDYNPETGIVSWKMRPHHHFSSVNRANRWNRDWAFKPVGCKSPINGKHNHLQVSLSYKGRRSLILVHRIAFAMLGKTVPDNCVIDHINGDPWDNRACNLRLATISENGRNCRPHADKKSPLPRGVYQMKGKPGYYSRISLGCFETAELAHARYCEVAKFLHGEFARYD